MSMNCVLLQLSSFGLQNKNTKLPALAKGYHGPYGFCGYGGLHEGEPTAYTPRLLSIVFETILI